MVSKIDKEKKEIVDILYIIGYSIKELEEMTILFWENRKQNPRIEMAEA
tara:strand:+ start:222 stop:368 length:147 start_codon:yes stop_codon:yes gene_type:complete